MTTLLSTAYLPPVQWFSKLLDGDVLVEQWESFQKQTYRNRCLIDSPNGALALTVPVERPAGGSRLVRDCRISDHGGWRRRHWHALVSSYENSPFFEYYQDDFRPFYERRWTFLVDFNEELARKCCELIDLAPRMERTAGFFPKGTEDAGGAAASRQGVRDCRDLISPKRDTADDAAFTPVPYYQVFAPQHGFLPGLSVADLLFNMGPESILVLRKTLAGQIGRAHV